MLKSSADSYLFDANNVKTRLITPRTRMSNTIIAIISTVSAVNIIAYPLVNREKTETYSSVLTRLFSGAVALSGGPEY